MSVYEGTIRIWVRFHADSGVTADQGLAEIAREIQEETNKNVQYDEDGNLADTFYEIVAAAPDPEQAERA